MAFVGSAFAACSGPRVYPGRTTEYSHQLEDRPVRAIVMKSSIAAEFAVVDACPKAGVSESKGHWGTGSIPGDAKTRGESLPPAHGLWLDEVKRFINAS